jgi:hypothetical protein
MLSPEVGEVMGLIRIARYADLQEARIAASLLDAAGIMAIVPEEQMGSNYFLLGQALGGYQLCVVEEEAQAALGLIAPHRVGNAAALDWRSHPDAATSAPASIFWAITDPTGGFAWARLRKKFTVTAFLGLLLGFLVVAVFVAAMTEARL